MSDDDDGPGPRTMETGRVARYFLYRNREKQAVRRPQLKTVLDSFRERSRKQNPIQDASRVLSESLGVKIVVPEGKKAKHFVTRDRAYPPDFPIPFTPIQKAEYGLLTFVFFIIYFKGDDGLDLEQLRQNVEANTGVDCDALEFGRWQDVVARWAAQDYVKLEKRDSADPTVVRKVVTIGPRFHAEFGEKTLIRMAKELIFDEAPPPEDEDEDEDEPQKEKDPEEDEPEDSVDEAPPRRARRVRAVEVVDSD
jgi:hypothetical protein